MGSGRWEAAITGKDMEDWAACRACWACCSSLLLLLPLGGKGVTPCPRSRSRRGEAGLGRLAGGRGIIGVCLATGTGHNRTEQRSSRLSGRGRPRSLQTPNTLTRHSRPGRLEAPVQTTSPEAPLHRSIDERRLGQGCTVGRWREKASTDFLLLAQWVPCPRRTLMPAACRRSLYKKWCLLASSAGHHHPSSTPTRKHLILLSQRSRPVAANGLAETHRRALRERPHRAVPKGRSCRR